MRKVDSIVPGRVVPAAVNIHKTGLARGQRKMTIRPIHQAARTLSFEVVDDIGERTAFEKIVIDIERTGAHFAGGRLNLNRVVANDPPRGKVCRPEDAAAP
jgi:hypothetical protein